MVNLTELYVYLSTGCNCSCRHCWIVDDARGSDEFLDVDVADAVFSQAQPLGLQRVKWTGGEPTIHPQFPELLLLQKKHGLQGRVETNGLEVTEELARLMKDCGVTHVSVSLDGALPATHDSIRGVRGAHERVLLALAALKAVSVPTQIIMTLMAENRGEVDALIELAQRAEVGSVKLNLLQPMLRGETLSQLGGGVPLDDLLSLRDHLEHDCSPRYSFPIFLDLPVAFRPLHLIFDEGPGGRCSILNVLGLLPDGSYALCGIGRHVPELVFGQAATDDLARVWNSHPVLEDLRSGIATRLEGICGRCLLNRYCLGSCVAQNYYRGGNLFSPFWLCEEAEAAGLFPAGRAR
jgi:SynChlorMet cassette radical SAM/SPASM protein ScmF